MSVDVESQKSGVTNITAHQQHQSELPGFLNDDDLIDECQQQQQQGDAQSSHAATPDEIQHDLTATPISDAQRLQHHHHRNSGVIAVPSTTTSNNNTSVKHNVVAPVTFKMHKTTTATVIGDHSVVTSVLELEQRHGSTGGPTTSNSNVNVHSARSHTSISSGASTTQGDICRICHCEGSLDSPLITPCYCSGSLKFVHQKCLQQWIKSSQTKSCEVCRYMFVMQTKMKPITKWEKLDISPIERRKICCSISFHAIAITCVCWSLYVLVAKTIEEIGEQDFTWPFWTKLVVVAIGFTGGVVFMYVQCKMYVQLCQRWKAYNKVIYVQNCPEKMKANNTSLGNSGALDQNYFDNCPKLTSTA